MYIIKNAFRNMIRNKGKNILIGVIVLVITMCTCVGLAIHKAGDNLVETYKETNPLAVSFNLDMGTLRNASDDDKNSFSSLSIEDIEKYADSDLVKDYYYTLEASVDSSSIEPVEDNKKPEGEENSNESDKGFGGKDYKMSSMGNFRVTAYSNFAYLDDFTNGTKKISEGSMVSGSGEENEIVISKSLAEENELGIDSIVTLCLSSDENVTFEFKVVGIYEDSSSSESSNFLQMNVLNSSNQLYANLNSVQNILDKQGEDNTKLVASNGLSAKFYLTSNDKLKKFEKEVRDKGLSDYYTVITNEDEILETLQPIQNISTFSFNFLIVIIIIGVVVLAVINFLNIRDRKYEIGVLRAIGMSKWKVTGQLVLEIFFVSLVALTIGTGIGVIVSQPVTNKMLESEIESYTNKETMTTENFGRNDMMRPSQGSGNSIPTDRGMNNKNKGMNTNVDYVDQLKVKIDFLTILQLVGITIVLTIVSGGVASVIVNKYSPNKILQNRV